MKTGPKPRPVADRLAERLAPSPGGCLLWTGPVNEAGYGKIQVTPGMIRSVHRAAWFAAYGWLPELLDHICHDPAECPGGTTCPHRRCCNVDHLVPSTRQLNNSPTRSRTAQMNRERGMAVTACKRGHPYTPDNTRMDKRGFRSCRECSRLSKRLARVGVAA